MTPPSKRLAYLNNKIKWFNNKYSRGQYALAPTPDMRLTRQYQNWIRERRALNKAARRIQRAVSQVKLRKTTARLLSYNPLFRSLTPNIQRSIIRTAYPL